MLVNDRKYEYMFMFEKFSTQKAKDMHKIIKH